jgi:hypothetical protein
MSFALLPLVTSRPDFGGSGTLFTLTSDSLVSFIESTPDGSSIHLPTSTYSASLSI